MFVPYDSPISPFCNSFRYIPTDTEKQKLITQWQAGIFIVYNTRAGYENVLKWAYLCALTEGCIAPTYEWICRFSDEIDKYNYYSGCHRFDQSTFNILLSNWFNYDGKRYTEKRRIFHVVRRPRQYGFQLLYCGGWLLHCTQGPFC